MCKDFFSLQLNRVLKCRNYLPFNLKRMIHSLFFDYRIVCNTLSDSNITVFNTTPLKKRADYQGYIDNFIATFKSQRNVNVVTIKYVFSPFCFFGKINFIFANYNKNIALKNIIQLSLIYILYKKISCFSTGVNSIITFCDAHPEDNLIAQFFKKNYGAKTYTLQHGYYTWSPGSINQEVYENFISDFMLCWGDTSVSNLVDCGLAKERLIPFGCFKNKFLTPFSGQDIFILLNGKHNSSENNELLSLAEKIVSSFRINVTIKKHPDDQTNYKTSEGIVFVDSIEHGVLKSKLAIISESGVFIDFYLSGMPVLILKTPCLKKEFACLPNAFDSDEIVGYIEKSSYPNIDMPKVVSAFQDFRVL